MNKRETFKFQFFHVAGIQSRSWNTRQLVHLSKSPKKNPTGILKNVQDERSSEESFTILNKVINDP